MAQNIAAQTHITNYAVVRSRNNMMLAAYRTVKAGLHKKPTKMLSTIADIALEKEIALFHTGGGIIGGTVWIAADTIALQYRRGCG